jgi:hypothetical protein
MDRLYSAYRMFLADGYTSDSFDSFVKATRSGKRSDRVWSGDMHIQSQWEAMGERNPDIAIRWDLEELGSVLGLSNIPHVGKGVFCTDMRLGPEAQRLFDDYYRKDVDLWNDRHTSGNS